MPLLVDTTFNANLATTTTKDIDLSDMEGVSVSATYSNVAPSAKVFAAAAVSVADNTATVASHGLVVGLKGQLSTSVALPGGLALLTDYFIIVVDASTIKFATTLANAVAGTAVDITTQGTGSHTFTATAAAGNVLKLQAGNDGTNFEDISGNTVTIATTTATKVWNLSSVYYKWLRIIYTPSAGQIQLRLDTSYRLGG